MTSCYGECLSQCMCSCYNEETNIYDEICHCGHREHNGYCPSTCCEPVICRGCKVKLPLWVTFCNNGTCTGCAVQMGPYQYSDKIEECCVCFRDEKMLILKCQHKICNDCWFTISTSTSKPLCPLCRNSY